MNTPKKMKIVGRRLVFGPGMPCRSKLKNEDLDLLRADVVETSLRWIAQSKIQGAASNVDA